MSSWHALHFNKIAKVLREKRKRKLTECSDYYCMSCNCAHRNQYELLNEMILEFAEYFKTQNEGFDAQKFVEACGFTKEDYINES